MNEIIMETWTERLTREAAGLDFTDAEDRAIFRGRVRAAVSTMKFDSLRELARSFHGRLDDGTPPRMWGRADATRALADAWIARPVAEAMPAADDESADDFEIDGDITEVRLTRSQTESHEEGDEWIMVWARAKARRGAIANRRWNSVATRAWLPTVAGKPAARYSTLPTRIDILDADGVLLGFEVAP